MSAHILIVDDEAAIRDMVRMALELEGYQVSDASNAHQANKLLEQLDIDLILLDWMMPGVSGIDFAGRIRREGNHHVGIIMVTAKDDENDLIRGLDVGADDYIKKPFSTKELISRMKAVLRRLSNNDIANDVVQAGNITQVYVEDRTVDVHIRRLRKVLKPYDCDQYIDTVRGVGYRFSLQVS